MKFHRSLLIGLCVASLGAISAPMTASAAVGVYFEYFLLPSFAVEPVTQRPARRIYLGAGLLGCRTWSSCMAGWTFGNASVMDTITRHPLGSSMKTAGSCNAEDGIKARDKCNRGGECIYPVMC